MTLFDVCSLYNSLKIIQLPKPSLYMKNEVQDIDDIELAKVLAKLELTETDRQLVLSEFKFGYFKVVERLASIIGVVSAEIRNEIYKSYTNNPMTERQIFDKWGIYDEHNLRTMIYATYKYSDFNNPVAREAIDDLNTTIELNFLQFIRSRLFLAYTQSLENLDLLQEDETTKSITDATTIQNDTPSNKIALQDTKDGKFASQIDFNNTDGQNVRNLDRRATSPLNTVQSNIKDELANLQQFNSLDKDFVNSLSGCFITAYVI